MFAARIKSSAPDQAVSELPNESGFPGRCQPGQFPPATQPYSPVTVNSRVKPPAVIW